MGSVLFLSDFVCSHLLSSPQFVWFVTLSCSSQAGLNFTSLLPPCCPQVAACCPGEAWILGTTQMASPLENLLKFRWCVCVQLSGRAVFSMHEAPGSIFSITHTHIHTHRPQVQSSVSHTHIHTHGFLVWRSCLICELVSDSELVRGWPSCTSNPTPED